MKILIYQDGRLLTSDFGFGTFPKYKSSYKRSRTPVGSREYMSPEVSLENCG